MNDASSDSGIPLLTEIIPVPETAGPANAVSTLASISGGTLPVPSEAKHASHGLLAAETVLANDEEKWRRLESNVTERVMLQVLEHVDFIVQQRVREGLADLLQTMTEGLAAEIKDELRTVLRETVPRIAASETADLKK